MQVSGKSDAIHLNSLQEWSSGSAPTVGVRGPMTCSCTSKLVYVARTTYVGSFFNVTFPLLLLRTEKYRLNIYFFIISNQTKIKQSSRALLSCHNRRRVLVSLEQTIVCTRAHSSWNTWKDGCPGPSTACRMHFLRFVLKFIVQFLIAGFGNNNQTQVFCTIEIQIVHLFPICQSSSLGTSGFLLHA